METENHGFLQTISLLSVALIALVVGVQKLVRDWKTTKAESNIIDIMHKEIERMSAQNSVLSVELGKLQEEIIELNKQISNLNIENNKLREEITVLTSQLNNLKNLTTINTKAV